MKRFLVLLLIIFLIVVVVYIGYNKSKENVVQIIDVQKFINYEEEGLKIEKIESKENVISGIVKNDSGESKRLVYIRFSGYDKDGNKLGTLLSDQVNKLENGETWEFEINFHEKNLYRIDDIQLTTY